MPESLLLNIRGCLCTGLRIWESDIGHHGDIAQERVCGLVCMLLLGSCGGCTTPCQHYSPGTHIPCLSLMVMPRADQCIFTLRKSQWNCLGISGMQCIDGLCKQKASRHHKLAGAMEILGDLCLGHLSPTQPYAYTGSIWTPRQSDFASTTCPSAASEPSFAGGKYPW